MSKVKNNREKKQWHEIIQDKLIHKILKCLQKTHSALGWTHSIQNKHTHEFICRSTLKIIEVIFLFLSPKHSNFASFKESLENTQRGHNRQHARQKSWDPGAALCVHRSGLQTPCFTFRACLLPKAVSMACLTLSSAPHSGGSSAATTLECLQVLSKVPAASFCTGFFPGRTQQCVLKASSKSPTRVNREKGKTWNILTRSKC